MTGDLGTGQTQIVSGPPLSIRKLSSRMSAGAFTTTAQIAAAAALADFDDDGRNDVVARTATGLAVYRNAPCPAP